VKILIAVVTCSSHTLHRDAIRETWLPLVADADVKFFLGSGAAREDEVQVECDDSYEGLPSKVRAIVRWALEHGYDYVFKCDDDVVLKPQSVLLDDLHDFTGHKNDSRIYPVPFGFLYGLSKRSMEIVATQELPSNNNDEVWVTSALSKAGIALYHNPRYVMYTGKREDFVVAKPKSLRAPHRSRFTPVDTVSLPAAHAYCMFFNWTGHRTTSDQRVVLEMRKVFQEYVACR
jgi:hypothetical protein